MSFIKLSEVVYRGRKGHSIYVNVDSICLIRILDGAVGIVLDNGESINIDPDHLPKPQSVIDKNLCSEDQKIKDPHANTMTGINYEDI